MGESNQVDREAQIQRLNTIIDTTQKLCIEMQRSADVASFNLSIIRGEVDKLTSEASGEEQI